jgi:hypothetical protein
LYLIKGEAEKAADERIMQKLIQRGDMINLTKFFLHYLLLAAIRHAGARAQRTRIEGEEDGLLCAVGKCRMQECMLKEKRLYL